MCFGFGESGVYPREKYYYREEIIPVRPVASREHRHNYDSTPRSSYHSYHHHSGHHQHRDHHHNENDTSRYRYQYQVPASARSSVTGYGTTGYGTTGAGYNGGGYTSRRTSEPVVYERASKPRYDYV